MRRLVLAFSLLGFGGCGDDTQSCTTAGCFDQLTIDLAQSFSPDDAYDVTVELADETITCSGQGDAFQCDGVGNADYSPAAVNIQGGQVRSVVLMRAPKTFRLVIESGGSPIVDETVDTISYSSVYPNGPECGPACHSGQVQL
ncbi:MAG: hypothetical protein H6718_21120 [Polyangiaceae bacterium]|nr:hypothetical protein [Myxococcales bacterium]MCB9587920.1 hypothetical protein [Polyangiaceae bacterium]